MKFNIYLKNDVLELDMLKDRLHEDIDIACADFGRILPNEAFKQKILINVEFKSIREASENMKKEAGG